MSETLTHPRLTRLKVIYGVALAFIAITETLSRWLPAKPAYHHLQGAEMKGKDGE